MEQTLYIATNNGLLIGQYDGDELAIQHQTLTDAAVTSVMAREGVILAGTQDGIFRSDDGGRTWTDASRGLSQRHVRWLAYHPDISDCEFAGTEPAALFVSHDGGDRWREAREVADLRDKHGWWLPYSPEAGCVRGFAFSGARAYAAVEVGAALRSDDTGETWHLVGGSDGQPKFGLPQAGLIHPDVHSINVHPSSPDIVFAPTAGGLYYANDGGERWTCLFECYCRAVWLDPDDVDHLIFGSANGPSGQNGQIWETHDGGATWQTAARGLHTPWADCLVERFVQIEDRLFGVLSNGKVIAAALDTLAWHYLLPDAPHINAITD